jgi:hypothetical protein
MQSLWGSRTSVARQSTKWDRKVNQVIPRTTRRVSGSDNGFLDETELCGVLKGNTRLRSSPKAPDSTRWFKHDRDKLWLVYTQSVPVIFEPPCNMLSYIKVSGNRIPVVARFSAPFQIRSDVRPASYTPVTRSFTWIKQQRRGINYPPPHLTSRLKKD